MVRTVQEGTNSPRYEQSRVRKVQRRYEQSMVRTVQEGTNSPGYEKSKRVRIVHGTNSPGGYEQSMVRTVQEGTNSPRYEQSRRVRTVHGTNSPRTVRTVHGTNSPRYEKSRYRTRYWQNVCICVGLCTPCLKKNCANLFFAPSLSNLNRFQ